MIQAFTGTHRPVLLDYPPDEWGAVAARLDPDAEIWRARFLKPCEPADPGAEVRFRQHTVTCTGTTVPLVAPDLENQ